jgi:hypothetical protein
VAVLAHDRRLTRGAEERAVLGPQVHEAMAEAVLDGVDAHVGQDPLGGMTRDDAKSVVEAVAAGTRAERLADPERHEVADDRQCGGRHVERGQMDPERSPAVTRRAGKVVHRPAGGHPRLETVVDRALVSRQPVARRAALRRRHVGPDGPRPGEWEVASAERGGHGEDLLAVDARNRASL